MSTVSFDQLPEMVAKILDEVDGIKDLINNKLKPETLEAPAKEWMNLNELCEYLPDKPSKHTVYTWVCNRSIPFHKKTKKLSFLKSEIDQWIIKSGHATAEDMKDIALETFGYRKGGLR